MTARMGIAGVNTDALIANSYAACGIAGLVRPALVSSVHAAVGIAGEPRGLTLSAVEQITQVTNASAHQVSNRIGDQAALTAWQRGCWFQDPTYLITRNRSGDLVWKESREEIFARGKRHMPLLIDSMGYRRELSGAAPLWTRQESVYPQMIELIQPDGYAAWDYPLAGPENKARTRAALERLMAIYPQDVGNGRMWPVFSVRWTWDERAAPAFGSLPGWGGRALQTMIPLTRTQRPYSAEQREEWARQAVANALLLASDPDFRWMAETFGRVMIGGLVRGDMARITRHLFAATLCKLFPDLQIWLLGQANFAVVNGLAALGLLDRCWVDGTWYLHDARADTFAVLDHGLITMNQIRGADRKLQTQSFFTLGELMAANLRALLAAYVKGHEWWPVPIDDLPLDQRDVELMAELRRHFQAAQLELGLFAA